MHILLIGTDFFNYKDAGDKNVWHNMLPYIVSEFRNVSIVSVNSRQNKLEVLEMNGDKVYIHNCSPVRIGPKDNWATSIGKAHRSFHANYFEKSLTMIRIFKSLKLINDTSRIDMVHFLNHFGSITGSPKLLLSDRFFSLSLGGGPKNIPFKRILWSQMVRFFDTIIVTSEAARDLFVNFGIDPNKISVIRWGVPEVPPPSDDEKEELRKKLRIPENVIVFLWSGFIQQIREREFRATIQYAKKIVPRLKDAYFIFSFKPEHYREQYRQWENERIRIIHDVHQFHSTLRVSDALFSPLVSRDVIVTPPLTWLESMALGIPVITTMAGGVTEVISHELDGMIAQNFSQLEEVLERFIQDPTLRAQMSVACRKKVSEKFSAKSAAEGYIKMWKECDAL